METILCPGKTRSDDSSSTAAVGAFHPVGALVLAATLEGEMRESHRSVALDAGTELTVVAESGATLDAWTHWTPPPAITSEVNADSIATLAPRRAQ